MDRLAACQTDLKSKNDEADKRDLAMEKKHSVLTKRSEDLERQLTETDKTVADLQAQLVDKGKIMDKNLQKLSRMQSDVTAATSLSEQRKIILETSQVEYALSIKDLTERMEGDVERLECKGKSSGEGSVTYIATSSQCETVQSAFDTELANVTKHFESSIAACTADCEASSRQLQDILEKQSAAWLEGKQKVLSLEELISTAERNVRESVSEVTVTRAALVKTQDAYLKAQIELENCKVGSAELQLKFQLAYTSHIGETEALKARIQALEASHKSEKNSLFLELSLLRSDNTALNTEVKQLQESLERNYTKEKALLEDFKVTEQHCPSLTCPTVDLTEYTSKLESLNTQIDDLNVSKTALTTEVAKLTQSLTFQGSKLDKCMNDCGNLNNDDVRNVKYKEDLSRCRREVTAMKHKVQNVAVV